MALLHLVYRDALFPRPAYRAHGSACSRRGDARVACRTMVDLLALAHERSCEAELADRAGRSSWIEGGLPDLARSAGALRPVLRRAARVSVPVPSIASYDVLLPRDSATRSVA